MRRLLPLALLLFSGAASAQPTIDLALTDADPLRYILPGTHPFKLGARVVSSSVNGFGNLNAMQVGWSFNGGPWQTSSATTPVFIPTGNYFPVNLPTTPSITVATPGRYVLKLWLKSSTINDPNPANDTLVRIVRVQNQWPPKNILFELFKFQNCAPCYKLDTAVAGQIQHRPYNLIARHFVVPSEPLGYTVSDTLDNTLDVEGHPCYTFDRFRFPGEKNPPFGLEFQGGNTTYVLDSTTRLKYYEPLSVSFDMVTYDSVSRQLTVRVKATVFDTLQGDHRFNLHLTEDSVYNFQSGLPSGSMYWHMRVLRRSLGGAWGQAGSMPSTLLPGQTYQHTFQYTVPASYKSKQLRLIGFVQHHHAVDTFNRRVLNSVGGKLNELVATSVTDVASSIPLTIYPNPVRGQMYLVWPRAASLRIRIISLDGRLLREWHETGTQFAIDTDDFPAGAYGVEATDGIQTRRGRFVKQD